MTKETKAKSRIFTITTKHIASAKRAANVSGVDFASNALLPKTLARASKLETRANKAQAGIFAGCAAAHMVRLGAGEYTARQMFSALCYENSKAQLAESTGSDAIYNAMRFYRNAILHTIETGKACDSNEARRIDLETGQIADKAVRAPRQKGAPKGKGKAKNSGTLAVVQGTKPNGKPCTIVTQTNVQHGMKADKMAAFLADIATQYMVTLECEDKDAVGNARANIDGYLARLVADVCTA